MIYDYEYFKKEIYSLTTIDLNAYKEKQMKRRIDTLIAKHKIVGYDKYVQALKTDRELFEEFVGYITINVSEFYRNPEQWKYLDETVIPELIQRFGKNLKSGVLPVLREMSRTHWLWLCHGMFRYNRSISMLRIWTSR